MVWKLKPVGLPECSCLSICLAHTYKIVSLLHRVDDRYNNLLNQANIRHQKLLDSLSLHKLNREANVVDKWIDERVSGIFTSFF